MDLYSSDTEQPVSTSIRKYTSIFGISRPDILIGSVYVQMRRLS